MATSLLALSLERTHTVCCSTFPLSNTYTTQTHTEANNWTKKGAYSVPKTSIHPLTQGVFTPC